jgi:protein-S-isoprenylcysteine O-methyltransferase Ste14
LFSLLVPGTVMGLLPHLLRRRFPAARRPGHLRYSGWPLILVGLGVYLRCARDFVVVGRGTPAPVDAPETLVAEGPYRHVRNPMYVGVLMVLAGQVIYDASVALAGYVLLLFAAFHLFIVGYEEPNLHRRFGPAYERYRQRVPRWLPRYTPAHLPPQGPERDGR